MRVPTEVGRRTSLHASGAGKVVLATLDDAEIQAILARTGLPARTPRMLRTIPAPLADADRISTSFAAAAVTALHCAAARLSSDLGAS